MNQPKDHHELIKTNPGGLNAMVKEDLDLPDTQALLFVFVRGGTLQILMDERFPDREELVRVIKDEFDKRFLQRQ